MSPIAQWLLQLLLPVLLVLSTIPQQANAIAAQQQPWSPRRVSCSNALHHPPAAELQQYMYAFRQWQGSDATVLDGSTLTFDSLMPLSGIPSGAVDLGEFLVTIGALEAAFGAQLQAGSLNVSGIATQWRDAWAGLAGEVEQEATTYLASGDNVSAASALHRQCTYLQLAERFLDHYAPEALDLYAQSVAAFTEGVQLEGAATPRCTRVHIPYTGPSTPGHTSVVANTTLHGYMCCAGATGCDAQQPRPLVLALSGYDAGVELLYHLIATDAIPYGFHVLLFEGPGQGSVARFRGLRFTPDYGPVVAQVLDFVLQPGGDYAGAIDASAIALWGISFGGFLAPSAVAQNAQRLAAVVANGGVLDFYQAMLCLFSEQSRDLFYSQPQQFSEELGGQVQHDLGLYNLMNFGALGFGKAAAATPASLLAAMQPYKLGATQLQALANAPLLVNAPPFDTMTGNQSALLYEALPRPVNAHTQLLVPQVARGGALHASIGSTVNKQIAFMRWLDHLKRKQGH